MSRDPKFSVPERPGIADQLATRLDGKVDERNPDVVWLRDGGHVIRCTFLGQVFLNSVFQVGGVGDGVDRIAANLTRLMDRLDAEEERVSA